MTTPAIGPISQLFPQSQLGQGGFPTQQSQQQPFMSRNLTQDLGLPNFTSQYATALAQDFRGLLFLSTGNPYNSPLMETMAYSQIPNVNLPVTQFSPRNPLNSSIDSIFNAPLFQNGALGAGLLQGNGNAMGQMTGGGQQTGSIFAPQQQQGGLQPIPQQGGNSLEQSIAQLQQQIQQDTLGLQYLMQQQQAQQQQQGGLPIQQGQGFPSQQQMGLTSLVSPVANGDSQQQLALQAWMNPQALQGLSTPIVGGKVQTTPVGQGYASPLVQGQGYGMPNTVPQGVAYGNASTTMQGYDFPQQQQISPYASQGGYPAYATTGGQMMYP